MEIFIAIFLILFCGLAYWKLEWAVLLLVAGLPSYLIRWDIGGLPGNLLEAMIGIAFLFWVVSRTNFLKFLKGQYKFKDLKNNRQKRLPYPFGAELILVLVVSFFAAGVAGFKLDALGSWRAYFFEPALLFILILNLFPTSSKREKLVWSLVASCLGLSIYAVIQKFTGIGIANELWRAESTRRVTSVFPYPNALALYVTPLIFVFLGYMAVLIKRKNFSFVKLSVLVLTIVLALASVYFARSEGALVAAGASSVFFVWLLGKKGRWFAYGLVVAAAAVLCLAPVSGEAVINKVALRDLSGEIRKQQWQETWHMLTDGRLVTGAGLHNYKQTIGPYHQPGIFFNKHNDPDFRRKLILFNEEYKEKFWQPVEIYLYPHNIFLNFWTELGFAGMMLFIWIIAKFFVKGFKVIKNTASEKRYWAAGMVAAMAVIVIHGMVDVPYFKNDLAAIFWILVALLSLVALEFNNKHKIKEIKHE